MATTAKELLDKAAGIKGSSIDVATEKNRALMMGGFIGLAAGTYYGFVKKQNMLVTALVGAVGGVVISKLFTPK